MRSGSPKSSENTFESVTAFAPATVANVACGFDLLGFALEAPGDEVTARFYEDTITREGAQAMQKTQALQSMKGAPQTEHRTPGVVISSIHNDGGRLPLEPESNTAGKAVLALLEDYFGKLDHESEDQNEKFSWDIELEITKKMPFGSGLGSSAASAVAAVTAVNQLIGTPYTKSELLPFALEGEAVASGAKHADNVAPSLLGGFVMVSSQDPTFHTQVPYPDPLTAVVLYPHIEIKTRDSRNVLPESVSFRDAVLQTEYMAGLITGLTTGDVNLIRRSLHDRLAEPYRASLIPDYTELKNVAIRAGALGCSISGSGPSVFALTEDPGLAEGIGAAMAHVMKTKDIPADLYISPINRTGSLCIASTPSPSNP